MGCQRKDNDSEAARWSNNLRGSVAASGGGAVAGDELRAVLFFLREGGIGFEAAAAAGFVGAHGADDDELFALNEALGVNGGDAATDTDGKGLGDFFRDGEEDRARVAGAGPGNWVP